MLSLCCCCPATAGGSSRKGVLLVSIITLNMCAFIAIYMAAVRL